MTIKQKGSGDGHRSEGRPLIVAGDTRRKMAEMSE